MAKSLVIVESPAKAKTLEKFLGKDFKVLASYGHVRDLPRKGLGVDRANGYEPTYEVLRGQREDDQRAQARGQGGRQRLPRGRPGPRGRSDLVAPPGDAPARRRRRRCSAASGSTRSPRRPCSRRWRTPARSTAASSTRSSRGASSTGSSATRSPTSSGRRSGGVFRPAASRRWRCGSSASARRRSRRSSRSSTGRSTRRSRARRRRPSRPGSRASTAASSSSTAPIRGWPTRPPRIAVRDDVANAAWKVASVETSERRKNPAAPVHHLAAPAGRGAAAGVRGPPHDADRPAALRGPRDPGAGNRRPHHLHAHRLDPRLGRRAEGGPRAHRQGVRRRVDAARRPGTSRAAATRRTRTRRSGRRTWIFPRTRSPGTSPPTRRSSTA